MGYGGKKGVKTRRTPPVIVAQRYCLVSNARLLNLAIVSEVNLVALYISVAF